MSKVTVIILTYNSRADISACLHTVKRQSWEGEYEIVVVDNNSQDDTVKIVSEHFPEVVLLKVPVNRGYAGGNNVGIRYALEQGTDYSVILNPDTEVDIDWLKNLVTVADEKVDAGLVQSKILFDGERYRVNTIGNPLHYLAFSWSGGYKKLSSAYRDILAVPSASGASLLVKNNVFERIGMFDEYLFMYHEDLDLSWRARLAGFNVYMSPDSKVYHKYSFSFGTRKFYYFERNRWVLFFSNYKILTILLFLPMFILTDFAMLGYSLGTGWFKYKIQSYFGFVKLLPHVIKKRFDISRFRVRSDKEMLQSMTAKLDFDDVNNVLIRYLYNPLARVYFACTRIFVGW